MEELEEIVVEIEDDFELDKIASCGQCFRARFFEDGTCRFITGEHVVYMRKLREGRFLVRCGRGAWERVWTEYFDLSRNYRAVRENAMGKNAFVDRAAECGRGIRVLRQDPWEMLVTFIISQRKNIPAISKAVEHLARKYGREIATGRESVHAFPTPEALCGASAEELGACGLGYRTAYVRDAAERVRSGALDLRAAGGYGDEELFAELLKVRGVGRKVADCVCLFGYGRTARVPVDVWISRAIEIECGGQSPFKGFGADAGIIQQYVFYYERSCVRGPGKERAAEAG